jgi:N-acetyl sugar amidotransferase
MKIPYPSKVNLNNYAKTKNNQPAYYGLPKDVKFCKKCVVSNQRPNSTVEFKNKISDNKETINFNENGICEACVFAEKKSEIDWERRERELRDICEKFRSNNGSYDCIVPGSGGKDSFYTAHLLKYKYGMKPLTVTWAPHIYTDWGFKNLQAWIHSGFDNILVTPDGIIHRFLTRLALENLFHPFQPFILGQKLIAAKIAKQYKINLIFYGESESEYGTADSTKTFRDISKKFFSVNSVEDLSLSGFKLKDLIKFTNTNLEDFRLYLPLKESEVENLQVMYLGHFLKWHPQSCYYYTIENSDFISSPERNAGTYSKYSSLDDKLDDLHFYTSGIKFGIGRATHDASQEIRSGDIDRDEGISLVKQFDLEFPDRFFHEILDYLNLEDKKFTKFHRIFENPSFDETYFKLLCDKFRSPHIWYYDKDKWYLREKVFKD